MKYLEFFRKKYSENSNLKKIVSFFCKIKIFDNLKKLRNLKRLLFLENHNTRKIFFCIFKFYSIKEKIIF